MATTWIVSANASRAQFFSDEHDAEPWKEINAMVNAGARLRTSETETDRIGPVAAGKSVHNVGGATPSKSYQPAMTPAQHQTELFAREVADYLRKGCNEGQYGELMLIASPEFLGVMRKLLDPNVQAMVKMEINKDYTQAGMAQLRELIQANRFKS